MKKIVSLILVLIFVCFTASGCLWEDIIKQITSTTINPEYEGIVWEEKFYCKATVDDDFVPGRVLVLLDKAISEPNKIHSKDFFVGVEIEEIIDLSYRETPLSPGEVFRQSLLLILVDKTKEAVIEAYKKLEQIDGIKAAEPDYYITYDDHPNDVYYSFSTTVTDQWALDAIEVPSVWDFTVGNNLIRVGVVDTGIASHVDLNGNYDVSDAWDFYDVSTTVPINGKKDTNSHGTHVAGIIGAAGNNDVGIVAW